jgi:hypothetical protein
MSACPHPMDDRRRDRDRWYCVNCGEDLEPIRSVKHHHLNPALARALDVLGLHARDDGDYQLGAEVLTLAQAVELAQRLNAGIRLADMNQAKAFVLGLHEIEADRLLRACLWRFRGKADVALLHVRSQLAAESGSGQLGAQLHELLLERAIAIKVQRDKRGLEP